MPVERASGGTSLIDVLDRVLDKGIVIDAWVRVSLVGIDLLTVEARIVVASIDTYIKYSEAVSQVPSVSRPSALESRTSEDLLAENASLRAQLAASVSREQTREQVPVRRARRSRRSRPPWSASRASKCSPARGAGASAPRRSSLWSTRSSPRRRRAPARWWPCAGWCGTPGSSGPSARWPTARAGTCSGLAGIGVSAAAVDAFSLDLGDRTHPLVVALAGGEPVAFHDSGQPLLRAVETPLGNLSFHAVPLGRSKEEIGPGMLLLTGITDGPVADDLLWAAELLGVRLASLWYRRAQADERRHKRERSWLFSIINAVTDPILLTDADGRILVANAGAETLLTAGEDKREGWRRAVALNNMLFSASLFTNAARSGPTRRELLLVDPSEGQDLLFEVLSTPVTIRPGETGVASVLRNVTDLRRATEEIEENYRRLRVAEAATRAERDRLDLILNSVLDPILVTDAEGNIVRMNPPAERMFTFPPGKRNVEMERRVRTNDAVFTSFVSSLYAGQALHWRRTLSLIDPQTGATVPVEAISGKVVSKHGEETAIVTILHDLTEAEEKAPPLRAGQAPLRGAAGAGARGHGRARGAERAAAPPGLPARAGVGDEVAVPRQRLPRAAHAAQRHHGLHPPAARGGLRRS